MSAVGLIIFAYQKPFVIKNLRNQKKEWRLEGVVLKIY